MRRACTGAIVALAVASLIIGFAPAAGAKLLGSGKACVHRDSTSFEGRGTRVRDVVRAQERDQLTKWIRSHATRAERAADRVGRTTITVDVWFHVIRKDTTVAGGNLPLSRINAQMDVLNDSFSGDTGGAATGFRSTSRG